MTTHTVESVGIDVSKATLAVALRSRDGTAVQHAVTNTERGIAELSALLQEHGTDCSVPCVLESTGDYHLPCALWLSNAGYSVKCINPLITKQYERSSVRGGKSDPIDAVRLAQIGVLEPNLPSYHGSLPMVRARKHLASLAKLDSIEQELRRHSRHLEETLGTLGITEDLTPYRDILAGIKKQKQRLQRELVAVAPSEVHLLATHMKGVTDVTLSALMVGLADKQFRSRDALVAYVGLDVMPRRSGTWIGRERLSKRGNAYLRKLLYQIGWGLSRHNARYRAIYLRMKKEGKHYTTCLIAIARKFLSFLYAFFWKKSIPLSAIA